MWRFWNCVPRFVRQQLHGPRASAGVYVEEEKTDHEVEKVVLHDTNVNEIQDINQEPHNTLEKESESCRWQHQRRQYTCRFRTHCKQDPPETGPKNPGPCDNNNDRADQQRQNDCHREFWSHFLPGHGSGGASQYGHGHRQKQQRCHGETFQHLLWTQQRSLDAITWGAGMVFGLNLSRKPQLQSFLETWKDPDKRHQWLSLLLRVAFSRPPATLSTTGRSIVQGSIHPQNLQKEGEEGGDVEGETRKETQQRGIDVADAEDKKTLSDVMQDFESSCQAYTAVASSVSGVLAAEQGQLTSAVEHLRLASQLGHAPAYFNLALCYEMGLGVEKDQRQAASYYRQAADLGHAHSIFNLALMTLKGEGALSKDRAKAIQLVNKAAKQGLAQAQTYLGVYYTEDDDDQQDFEQAAFFFKAAASQHDAEAQYFLGICYENGWGVESSDEEAAQLYSAAAELGHDGALYNMAAFHEHGLGGLQADKEEAMSLYRRAADQGNESAKFRLQEEEARKALDLWAEHADDKSGREQSPTPRLSPHSSSPVLTDYVRESFTGLWSGELGVWFSAQSLRSRSSLSKVTGSPTPRPTFVLGDSSMSTGAVETDKSSLDVTTSLAMGQGCSVSLGLHRTSTMPELKMVSCQ